MRQLFRAASFSILVFGALAIASAAGVEVTPRALAAENSTPSSESIENFIGKIVGTIEVEGLKRIEKDAVIAKLTNKPGQELTEARVRADIQNLFNMGFFDDIEIRGESPESRVVNLVIVVKERPVISKVSFEGNERMSEKDLQDVVKVKEWSILDVNKIKEDTDRIQKHYEEKGFYLAKVTYELRAVEGKSDEVQVVYRIADYDKVQIKRITFLNNKRFSDDQLKKVFQETREGGFFSFLSGAGSFKESSFKQDLQRLTYWYLDHGYVKFRYESPVVTVTDDKRYVFISIYVDEGEQYSMGALDFGGDLLFTKDELHHDLTLKEGQTFSISERNADIQRLTEKYQDLGYAFVNVIPKMSFRDEARLVDIEYDFEKGNLTYFGEFTMVGNTKTHDKVIRRELKIHEGELFNGTRLRQSRENVERLGFFSPGEVVFNQVTPKGRNDLVNIDISVKERSTGTITLGAGYGSQKGFFFQTTIAEINLLGRGQSISLSSVYAPASTDRSFSVGFTEPYTLDTQWSSGTDIYYISYPVYNKYTVRKLGFDVRLGHPLFEYTQGYVTYKNEGMQLTNIATLSDGVTSAIPQAILDSDRGVLSSITLQGVRDKRNNRFETTGGDYQSFSVETAGLGGDKKFIKWIANSRYYTKLVGDLVFRNNIETGSIYPLEDRPTPSSEQFLLGGPSNLKGFQPYSVGPGIVNNGTFYPFGGNFEAFSLFELEYPLIREAGLKWVVFYDAGNSWVGLPTSDALTIRTDAGVGIRWFSPIGPLRFEWGFPFNKRPNEDSLVFSFFIGPPF